MVDFQNTIFGHNFWLECPTKVISTQLSYILNALFRDTPLAYSFSTSGGQVAGGHVATWPRGQVARWPGGSGHQSCFGKSPIVFYMLGGVLLPLNIKKTQKIKVVSWAISPPKIVG